MLTTRLVVWTFSVAVMTLGGNVAFGQNYPNKPIRIVTGETGGSGDFLSRLISRGISGPLGQQVIVENRPAGVIPMEIVAKASPDGYTMLIYTSGFWVTPLLQKKSPYDPVKDFAPITILARAPNVLVVHPSVPVKSVKELIALAKAKPGVLNYASSGTGTSSYLTTELFKSMAGVNIVHIPFKGNGPALVALIGGEVQVMFPSAAATAPHLNSGKLRALAVTSTQPSELLPGLPTVAASGVPDYESVSMTVAFAPAKTLPSIIKRLNQEILRILAQPDVKQAFLNAGIETVGSSPEQLASTIKSETARLGKVIEEAGIKSD